MAARRLILLNARLRIGTRVIYGFCSLVPGHPPSRTLDEEGPTKLASLKGKGNLKMGEMTTPITFGDSK
jgi:hypothetical protein